MRYSNWYRDHWVFRFSLPFFDRVNIPSASTSCRHINIRWSKYIFDPITFSIASFPFDQRILQHLSSDNSAMDILRNNIQNELQEI